MRSIYKIAIVFAFAGFALLSTVLVFAGPAHADKRVALVIGNSAYMHVPRLANPANDAELMAETVRGLGFTLIGNRAQLDLDKRAFDSAVQAFGSQLQGADVGLFYYAGHGVQVRGANFLVPVGANPTKEADVDFQMLDTNLVLRQMESAGTKLNLVILDACRNNPFGGRGLRAMTSGLATMQAPEGTLISFATQPGSVALDGTGQHSPFTQALARTIRTPGLDIFRTFNEVGLAVAQATGGQQQPWMSLSPIKGEFFFAGRATGAEPPATMPVKQTEVREAERWQAILRIGGHKYVCVNVTQPDGRYRLGRGCPPPVAGETGQTTIGADGTWAIRADSGRVDHGTIEWIDADTFIAHSATGSVRWKRVKPN